MRKSTVILVAGSSAGHLYPARALAEYMMDHYPEIEIGLITGDSPSEHKILHFIKIPIALKLESRPVRNFRTLIYPGWYAAFLRNFIRCLRFFREYRPRSVIGFGGYHVLPALIAAWCLKIPIDIQEQNKEWGLANRLMKPFARNQFESFPRPGRLICGMPVRPSFRAIPQSEALNLLGLSAEKKTLLVMGGSHGSQVLNQWVSGCFRKHFSALNQDWQLVHIAGSSDVETMREDFLQWDIEARVFSFVDDVGSLYSAADLVFSRAGAVTLHEAAFFAKPLAVLPHPNQRSGQWENALHLSREGALLLIPQWNMHVDTLYCLLEGFVQDPKIFVGQGRILNARLCTQGAEHIGAALQDALHSQDKRMHHVAV